MGDQGGQVENGNGPPGKAQLEDLSKEDLLQQLKKQRMLLQKMKQKCDELTQKNNILESSLAKERECFVGKSTVEVSQEKLRELEKECSTLQERFASVQEDNCLKSRKNKELMDQLECMEMKEETMNSAMMCIQEEINKLSVKNKDLQNELETLRVCCDHTSTLSLTNAELVQTLRETEQNCQQLTEVQDKLKHSLNEKIIDWEQAATMLEQERKELLALREENEQLIMDKRTLNTEMQGKKESLQVLTEKAQTLMQMVQSLEDTKSELEQRMEDSTTRISNLQLLLEEKEKEKQQFLEEIQKMEELCQTVEKLQKTVLEFENASESINVEQMKLEERLKEETSECKRLHQALEQLDRNKKETEQEKRQLITRKSELENLMHEKTETLNLLNEEYKMLNVRIESLVEMNADLQRKVGGSADHVLRLEALLEESKLEKQSFVAELQKLDTLCLERDQLLEELKQERKHNSQTVETQDQESAGSELNKLKHHIELLEAELEFTKVERDRLMFEENREEYESVNFSDSDIHTADSEVHRLKKCIEILEAELTNTKEERDRLMFQEEKEDLDGVSMHNRLQELEIELEDVKCKLESSEFEAEELRANLEDSQQELTHVKSMIHLESTTELASSCEKNEASMSQSTELSILPALCHANNDREIILVENHHVTVNNVKDGCWLEENRQRLEILESEKSFLESKLTSVYEQEGNLKCIVKEILVCINENGDEFTVCDEDHITVWLQCLKVQLFVLTEKCTNLTIALQEKDAEINAVKNELLFITRTVNERDETILKMKTNLQTLQTALDEGIEKKHCLEEEFNKLKVLHLESEKTLVELKTEKPLLESDLKYKEKQMEEYILVTEEKSKLVKLMGDDNVALKNELLCLNDQLLDSIGKQQELQSAFAEKEKEYNQLFQEQVGKTEQIHALSFELEALNLRKAALEQQMLEMEEIQSKLTQTEIKSVELGKEVELLQKELIQQQKQNTQLINDVQEAVENKQGNKMDIAMQTDETKTVEIEQLQQAFDLEREERAKDLEKNEDVMLNLSKENECLQAEVTALQESIKCLHGDAHMSSQDFSKLEVALEESAERVQKYKAVAMKTKKELLEAKQQISEVQVLQVQTEAEKETAIKQLENYKEVLQEIEDKCSRLQNDLDKALYDMATVRSQLADLQVDKDNMQSDFKRSAVEKKQLEHIRDDLASQVSLITEGKAKAESLCDQFSRDVCQLQDQLKALDTQLSKEKETHQSKSLQLEKLQQQMKQKNLMNLEIEDYERLVRELNQQVVEYTSQKEKMEEEMKKQEEMELGLRTQLEQVEAQRQQAEERGNKLKALLVKAKKDLAEGKRKDAEHQTALTKIQTELELCKQESERLKVEYAEILGQNQKTDESMRLMKESQHRIVRSLEDQVSSLQEDYSILRHEYDACQAEYEGYKVRVHSVLKQQKSKVAVPSGSFKVTQDLESLEKANEHFKIKLQEASDQLSASLSENQILQDEHDRLLQRHNKLLQEIETKETEWRIKLASLVTEGNAQEDEHEETIQQLQRQNETVTATFKEQLRTVKAEYERSVESLNLQLAVAEAEICRLQRDQQKLSPTREDDLFDVTITERQEGEGSENTEPVSSTPNKIHDDYPTSSSILSLEQLLSTDDKTSITSAAQNDFDVVEVQLGIAAKRIDHLSELLNESEASNIRLAEQTRVLKEEIRRLERNQQREQHVSNLEYLKNVVIKFLTLQAGDERERLIPVLTMLLQLSPQERSELGAIAKGASADGGEGASSSWENYLPRWSGLV